MTPAQMHSLLFLAAVLLVLTPAVSAGSGVSCSDPASIPNLMESSGKYYSFTLGETSYVKITMTPVFLADYDLYVRWDGGCPSTSNYDCRPYSIPGTQEECINGSLPAGTYYAYVRCASCYGGSYNITAVINGSGSTSSWNKTAGGSSTDTGSGVAVDSGDNVIVSGYTSSYGAGGYDVWTIKYDSHGNLLWNKTTGGSGNDYGYGVAVDDNNNIIVAGSTISFSGNSYSDIWILKYDSNGNLLWNKTAGGSSSDLLHDVAVDGSNNIIVTGYSYSSSTGYDYWTLKYDSNGNLLWNKTEGGSSSDFGRGVTVDSSNNVIVTGETASYGTGQYDVWTIKYDSNGNRVWNKTRGGIHFDVGYGVAVDGSNNIIVTGYTSSYGAGGFDVWTIKYDSNGNLLWNKTAGGIGSEAGWGVGVDSNNNIFVSGYTNSTGAGNQDFWTIKYNSDGNHLWNATAGGSNTERSWSMTVDSSDNPIATGDTKSFGAGSYDMWTIKYTNTTDGGGDSGPGAADVLFDEAHLPGITANSSATIYESGNSGGYTSFMNHLIENGSLTAATLTNGSLTSSLLSNYNILIIAASQDNYTTAEKNAIDGFVENGGGLLLIGDWGNFSLVPETISELFNITFNQNILQHPNNHEGDSTKEFWAIFDSDNIQSHNITSGVSEMVVYASDTLNITNAAGAVPLIVADSDATYMLSPQATGDMANAGAAESGTIASAAGATVAAAMTYGSGCLVVIGDTNVFETTGSYSGDADEDGTENLYDRDNEVFALNAVNWLKTCNGSAPQDTSNATYYDDFINDTGEWAWSGSNIFLNTTASSAQYNIGSSFVSAHDNFTHTSTNGTIYEFENNITYHSDTGTSQGVVLGFVESFSQGEGVSWLSQDMIAMRVNNYHNPTRAVTSFIVRKDGTTLYSSPYPDISGYGEYRYRVHVLNGTHFNVTIWKNGGVVASSLINKTATGITTNKVAIYNVDVNGDNYIGGNYKGLVDYFKIEGEGETPTSTTTTTTTSTTSTTTSLPLEFNITNSKFRLQVGPDGHYYGWTDHNQDGVFNNSEAMFYNDYTSFYTIKIDGTSYYDNINSGTGSLGDYVSTSSAQLSDTRAKTVWDITPKNVKVTQYIQVLLDTIVFTIKIKNTGSTTISDVDFRQLWDTKVGSNDAASLKEEGGRPHTKEYEFTPSSSKRYWIAAENTTSGSLAVHSWWSGGSMPDKTVFCNWGYAGSTTYDYTLHPSSSVSDSVILTYWENMSLTPGQERRLYLYYSAFPLSNADEVNMNATTDKNTYFTDGNNSEPVVATVNVWDGNGNAINGLRPQHFTTAIGSTEYAISGFNDHGGGEYEFTINPPTTTGSKTLTINVSRSSSTASNTTSFTMANANLTVASSHFEWGYTDLYKNDGSGVETETPVYTRGDNRPIIYKIYLYSQDLNVYSERNNISVTATIVDANDTTSRMPVNVTGHYAGGVGWTIWWAPRPASEHPIGKYNMTITIKYKGMTVQTITKNFYLTYEIPSGQRGYVLPTVSTPVTWISEGERRWVFKYDKRQYSQYDNSIWQLALDWASGTKDVNETVEIISRLVRTVNGNSTFHHADYDERTFEDSGYDVNADGSINATDNWDHEYDGGCNDFSLRGYACNTSSGSLYRDSNGRTVRITSFEDAVDFQQSDFDPENRVPNRHPVGVCQDYATLTVGYLRALGIPARYIAVLGYRNWDTENSFAHAAVQYYYNNSWRHLDTDLGNIHDDWLNYRFDPLVYVFEEGYRFNHTHKEKTYGIYYKDDRGYLQCTIDGYDVDVRITGFDFTDGTSDYNYGDTVNFDVTVSGNSPRQVRLKSYAVLNCDSNTTTQIGIESISSLSGSNTESFSHTLPQRDVWNGIMEYTCDMHIITKAYAYTGSKEAIFDTYEIKVPGFSVTQKINYSIDGNTGELLNYSGANYSNINATENGTQRQYTFTDRAESISEFVWTSASQNNSAYSLFKWSIENSDSTQHNYSLTVPVYAWGDSIYSATLGNITASGTIGNNTNYIVFYNSSNLTYVTVYVFSENITVLSKQSFTHENVTGLNNTIQYNTTIEAGKYDELYGYMSRRLLNGTLENTYQNIIDEINANGDSLLDIDVTVNQTLKPGDNLTIQINATTQHKNQTLNLTITAVSDSEYMEESDTRLPLDNLSVTTQTGATVTYNATAVVPNSTAMGNWSVEVKTASPLAEIKDRDSFLVGDAFNVTTQTEATATQNANITFNVTVENTWPKTVNNMTIEVDLHGNFNTTQNLTTTLSSMTQGATIQVNYTLNTTARNTSSITVTVSSKDGGSETTYASINVSGLPTLTITFENLTRVNANETFNLTANITNEGGVEAENITLNLTKPDYVTTSSSPATIANLSAGATTEVVWQLSTNETEDFSLIANATDQTGEYSGASTIALTVYHNEMNLTCTVSDSSVYAGETINLTCSLQNRGGLNLTNVDLDLILPAELNTTNQTSISVGTLGEDSSYNTTWVISGASPGYGTLNLSAIASEVTDQEYLKTITVDSLNFTLTLDNNTVDSNNILGVTVNLTNNNAEVTYSDLTLNYTVNSTTQNITVTEQTIYSMGPLANTSKTASWDPTGYASGNYTLTVDIIKGGATITSQSTQFAVTGGAQTITLATGWNLISIPLNL